MKKNILLILIVFVFLASGNVSTFSRKITTSHDADVLSVILINGEKVKVVVSRSASAGDLEGTLKEKTRYSFLKFKYRDNYFSVNIPDMVFQNMPDSDRKVLVRKVVGLYSDSFDVFGGMFGYMPQGYKFNMTFGNTKRGEPFNRVYVSSKTSNIFSDFIPFYDGKVVFSKYQRLVLLHEIGHSLFAIAIGSMQDSRSKAIEEGLFRCPQ